MFEKIIQNKFDKNLEEFKSELTKINDKFNIEYSKLHENRVN
jgi:ABC-type Zn uptake system ZnuABC Zn-binding protein ZnuA